MTPLLRPHPDDDVAIAIAAIPPGTLLLGAGHTSEAIPTGHKVALHAVLAGAVVRKYGKAIGAET